MIDVSIIIPSWNAKNYLQECIESIFRETNNCRIEVIVVDNASTDGSPDMVKDLFPQIKLIRNKENLGFAKANNIGIRQEKGKYVAIVNSDVKIERDCITRMYNYMEQNPTVGILGPKILGPDGIIQRSCMGFPTLWNSFCRALALDNVFPGSKMFGGQLMTFWPHDTVRKVDIINGCLWMVRREAINQIGLLDENYFMYSEDKDWCKRFWKVGWKVLFLPDAQAIHYGGGSSSNAPIKFSIEMLRSDLQYWGKHHKSTELIVYKLILLCHHFIRIIGQMIKYIIRVSNRTQFSFKIKRSLVCIRWLLLNTS